MAKGTIIAGGDTMYRKCYFAPHSAGYPDLGRKPIKAGGWVQRMRAAEVPVLQPPLPLL